jgi:hypothetical protein
LSVLIVALLATQACSSPSAGEGCSGASTLFSGNVCLDFRSAGALAERRAEFEAEVESALFLVRAVTSIDDLRISIISDAAQVIPEIGLGGFNPSANEIEIYGDPNLPDLSGVIESELFQILAHEVHHVLRRRAVGYGTTLLQAAVSEGLADHFVLELREGEGQPWSVALEPDELEVWLPEVIARANGPYDHEEWFYGTTSGVPRWAGYAVGFALVQKYLDDHPGLTPSGLANEPAIAFIPE